MADANYENQKQRIQALFAVWTSAKIVDATPLVTEDFELIDHAAGGRFVGIDAVQGFFDRAGNWSGTFEVKECFPGEDPDRVAVRWELNATHGRTGKSVSTPGMSLLVFRGDRVCSEIDHYSLSRQPSEK